MTSYVTPRKNVAFKFNIALVDQTNTKLLKVNPTIASGDFKVSTDNGAFTNLATLPSVNPAGGRAVLIDLSAGEMNGDNVIVQCVDAAGAEWCDLLVNIQTTARQIDDLAYPATSGRSIVVDAAGLVDANAVKLGPSGSGTAQTARDIGTSVLLSAGSGTGQLDFTSGVVKANATQWLGGAIPAVNVTGVPLVDLKYTLGTISPATAGSVRADAVTGAVGSVTGAVGSVTAAITLPSIPANWITAAGINAAALNGKGDWMVSYTQPTGFLAATFPTGTVANTTNITAGTITTATNLTNLPSIPANWLTAAGINAGALNGKGDWNITVPDNTSITAIKAKTDSLNFTVAGKVDSNILYVNGVLVNGAGTVGSPWGP